jgi:hypothetical protein
MNYSRSSHFKMVRTIENAATMKYFNSGALTLVKKAETQTAVQGLYLLSMRGAHDLSARPFSNAHTGARTGRKMTHTRADKSLG